MTTSDPSTADPSATSAPISTPCIGVCQFDHDRQVCSGCSRTLEHIANWARYSEQERQEIIEGLPKKPTDPAIVLPRG